MTKSLSLISILIIFILFDNIQSIKIKRSKSKDNSKKQIEYISLIQQIDFSYNYTVDNNDTEIISNDQKNITNNITINNSIIEDFKVIDTETIIRDIEKLKLEIDDEFYKDEISNFTFLINKNEINTISKINTFQTNILNKINSLKDNIKTEINKFTKKLLEKAKEMNCLLIFAQLQSLKLSIFLFQSEMDDLNIEILELKNLLNSLLGKFRVIKSICNLYKSCGECLSNNHCGWCDEKQECVLGDENSPKFDLCQFYSYKKCNTNPCKKHQNCEV